MQLPLSISEQERLVKGHEALMKAMELIVRANNDCKKFPTSTNYRRKLSATIDGAKKVAINEKQHCKPNQKEIF